MATEMHSLKEFAENFIGPQRTSEWRSTPGRIDARWHGEADPAARETTGIPAQGFTRPKTRRNFPAHLPRRRIVHPAPACCPCCGGTSSRRSARMSPRRRQLFVTEHVREKQLPVLREGLAAAGPLPCDLEGLRRAEPAGDDPGRQIRQSSAAQPAERAIGARGRRALGLDHGRSRRRLRGRAVAACRIDQGSGVRTAAIG